jgi:hypothetical protein
MTDGSTVFIFLQACLDYRDVFQLRSNSFNFNGLLNSHLTVPSPADIKSTIYLINNTAGPVSHSMGDQRKSTSIIRKWPTALIGLGIVLTFVWSGWLIWLMLHLL